MILHQFNDPRPWQHHGLTSIADSDGVLLLDDSVYWLARPNWRDTLPTETKVYALVDDVLTRGISLPDSVIGITYSDWVDLTLSYEKTVSW